MRGLAQNLLPFCLLFGLVLGSGCTTSSGSPDAEVIVRDAGGDACNDPPEPALPGTPCGCPSDCYEGAVCVVEAGEGIPGGMCLLVCGEALGECPAGTDCLMPEGGTEGLCLLTCSTNAECPTAYSCDGELCYGMCQADAECLSGHCDLHRALCTDGTPIAGAENLEPCLRDDDCRSRHCAAEIGYLCASQCSLERRGCPTNEICLELAEPQGDLGICSRQCLRDEDCTDALACRRVTVPEGTLRLCVPG